MHILGLVIWLIPAILSCSCSQEDRQQASDSSTLQHSCIDCHSLHPDVNHSMPCTQCHKGQDNVESAELAHQGLIRQPSHPDNMSAACGSCHKNEVEQISDSLHVTLAKMTNTVRTAADADSPLADFRKTPEPDEPNSILELTDDLLRRRCFRCHLYSAGDSYPAVHHGTGCSACHLSFYDGELQNHQFAPPSDKQCLSCHYGNYVGADYYGRFEHDFNNEYRTPYTTKEDFFRPYGVEYHQLQPDIHQQAGMVCIDCHSGKELMTSVGQSPSCRQCHDAETLGKNVLPAIHADTQNGKTGFFIKLHDETERSLPLMKDQAHTTFSTEIDCQVCHAQWSFVDSGRNYLRSDIDEYDTWNLLTVQGSSEVEHLLDNNLDFAKNELPPETSDGISGTEKAGIWYKGYLTRRWEDILIACIDNRLTVVRPMLDLKLSWVDEDDVVRFDAVSLPNLPSPLLPYTPHTTGHAGIFYKDRLAGFLNPEGEEREEN